MLRDGPRSPNRARSAKSCDDAAKKEDGSISYGGSYPAGFNGQHNGGRGVVAVTEAMNQQGAAS